MTPITVENPAAELAVVRVETSPIVQALEGLRIQSAAEADQVAGVVREAKARGKILEEREKEITRPLNAAAKAVRDLFREPRALLERVEALGKTALAGWSEEQERARLAAVQAAAEAFRAGDSAGGAAAVQSVAALATTPPAGISTRDVWEFEVTDPDSVPRELCTPDDARIRAALKAFPTTGEPPTIPGVRVVKRRTVAARR